MLIVYDDRTSTPALHFKNTNTARKQTAGQHWAEMTLWQTAALLLPLALNVSAASQSCRELFYWQSGLEPHTHTK